VKSFQNNLFKKKKKVLAMFITGSVKLKAATISISTTKKDCVGRLSFTLNKQGKFL